jgi:hypothetical protein
MQMTQKVRTCARLVTKACVVQNQSIDFCWVGESKWNDPFLKKKNGNHSEEFYSFGHLLGRVTRLYIHTYV